jgi:sn-glycerol 3-phosphate transport system substrate-binding protein
MLPTRTRRPKRTTLTLLTALVLALVAVACSDPPTAGDGDARTAGDAGDAGDLPECPLDALEEAPGPVEATLWYGGLGGVTKITMDETVARFNASQDEVVLNASDQGQSYQEVFRKYESAASASPDQLPDLIYLEDTELQAMIDGGRVLPAQACMEAAGYDITEVEPAVRGKYTVDGVLYPGYLNASTPILYYNKAHWVQAGLDPDDPPETLDEVYEQARALKEAGVSERPFVLKNTRWFFETWLSGVGIDMVDNNNGRAGRATEATFDTPEARELFELLQQMADEGLLNVFANTEGNIDHYLALVQEQSSMIVETSTASTTIADVLGGELTAAEAGVDFDESVVDRTSLVPATAPYPGIEAPGEVFTSGGAFFILNTSDPAQQAASWKLLEFMLQPENAKEWHLSGSYLPIVKAVLDEQEVQDFWADTMAGVLLVTAVEQLGNADPDRPGPLMGPYPDFADEVEGAMDAILLNGADVESTLSSAEERVTASLERYGAE